MFRDSLITWRDRVVALHAGVRLLDSAAGTRAEELFRTVAREGFLMSKRHVWAVIALVAVFAWSAVMVAVGQTAAIAALVPSLIFAVERAGVALADGEPRRTAAGSRGDGSATAAGTGNEEHAG